MKITTVLLWPDVPDVSGNAYPKGALVAMARGDKSLSIGPSGELVQALESGEDESVDEMLHKVGAIPLVEDAAIEKFRSILQHRKEIGLDKPPSKWIPLTIEDEDENTED